MAKRTRHGRCYGCPQVRRTLRGRGRPLHAVALLGGEFRYAVHSSCWGPVTVEPTGPARENGEHSMTKALGVKCTKDSLDWAVLTGDDRGSATILEAERATAPSGSRGQQLVWVRKEIQELLQKHAVDEVVLRAVEPGGQGNSLPRAEVEGVVQEAVAAEGVSCRRVVAVSMRSAFSAKNGEELQAAVMAIPTVATRAKSRQDPVTAALVAFRS